MIFAIHDISASGVNLLMNDYAAGLPSPLSFLGLGDALMREFELEPWKARTIPVLHNVTPSQGRTKPEMENKSGEFSPVETMEDLVGHVQLSLIIDLPGCDSATKLKGAIVHRRVAGGTIQNDEIRVDEVTADGSAFRKIRRGYALLRPESQSDGYLQISTGCEDSIASVAHKIFPAVREPGSGWFVPVSVGYKLLEDPNSVPQRIRTRSREIPHVFAEPVLGMAEMISVRNQRLTSLTEEGLDALFWQWTTQGEYILGHVNYMPDSIDQEESLNG